MPIDPRTLSPTPPQTAGSNPVVFMLDGGAPNTTYSDSIDGGDPSQTGPVINGN